MAKKMQYQTVWTQGKKGSDDAFFVRANVFVSEQGFKVEFDDLDKVCWHLTVYDRNEPIGAARIYQDTDGVWQLGRICVLENYRGKKIGNLILSACEEKSASLPKVLPLPDWVHRHRQRASTSKTATPQPARNTWTNIALMS